MLIGTSTTWWCIFSKGFEELNMNKEEENGKDSNNQ